MSTLNRLLMYFAQCPLSLLSRCSLVRKVDTGAERTSHVDADKWLDWTQVTGR